MKNGRRTVVSKMTGTYHLPLHLEHVVFRRDVQKTPKHLKGPNLRMSKDAHLQT